jgi:hypothetical protein
MVLDEGVEVSCVRFPFIVERLVLFIIRCACELVPQVSENISTNGNQQMKVKDNKNPSSRSSFLESSQSYVSSRRQEDIWQCLRYFRNLPMEIIEVISGQISYGLLQFVK